MNTKEKILAIVKKSGPTGIPATAIAEQMSLSPATIYQHLGKLRHKEKKIINKDGLWFSAETKADAPVSIAAPAPVPLDPEAEYLLDLEQWRKEKEVLREDIRKKDRWLTFVLVSIEAALFNLEKGYIASARGRLNAAIKELPSLNKDGGSEP